MNIGKGPGICAQPANIRPAFPAPSCQHGEGCCAGVSRRRASGSGPENRQNHSQNAAEPQPSYGWSARLLPRRYLFFFWADGSYSVTGAFLINFIAISTRWQIYLQPRSAWHPARWPASISDGLSPIATDALRSICHFCASDSSIPASSLRHLQAVPIQLSPHLDGAGKGDIGNLDIFCLCLLQQMVMKGVHLGKCKQALLLPPWLVAMKIGIFSMCRRCKAATAHPSIGNRQFYTYSRYLSPTYRLYQKKQPLLSCFYLYCFCLSGIF